MNKKRLLITIIVLLIALIIGIVFITAGRQKPAVLDSKIQMTAFNAGLEPKEHAPGYGTTYEIFVYSFCDSDGDGIGDINGIRSKLDYIEDLGFDAIWLTPVHPSPTYHKYDVTDYFTIDPVFGTLEDYEALIAECHERGIKVIMDMVLNHTSTEHGWFKEASDYLRELPDDWEPDPSYCQYFDYYNFSRESKEGYAPLEGTNWYYEARFWSGMPDLNLSSGTGCDGGEPLARMAISRDSPGMSALPSVRGGLAHQIWRTAFRLGIYPDQVCAKDTGDEQLDTADKDDDAYERRPSRDWIAHGELADYHEQQGREGAAAAGQAHERRKLERKCGEGKETVARVHYKSPERPARLAGDSRNVFEGDPFRPEADPLVYAAREAVDLGQFKHRIAEPPRHETIIPRSVYEVYFGEAPHQPVEHAREE